jgi:hypothetical protein
MVLRPPAGFANENAAIDESQNVAQGGILGTRGKLSVLRCCERALKAIMQAVQHEALAFIGCDTGDSIPEACFGENGTETGSCTVYGAA